MVLRFAKIDSFIEDKLYFWFDYVSEDEYGSIRITTNNIDNSNDWDLIEEFGIDENQFFMGYLRSGKNSIKRCNKRGLFYPLFFICLFTTKMLSKLLNFY